VTRRSATSPGECGRLTRSRVGMGAAPAGALAMVVLLTPVSGIASQSTPALTAGRTTAAHAPVPVSVLVAPDTVRVGQPFRVVVRVRVPEGATVAFPLGPDSGTAVEALDPRVLSSATDSSGTTLTATYRLAAWDLGRQAIPFTPIAVHAAGADRAVPLGNLSIVVAATTPGDAAHRVPRAARPMYALPRAWWPPWAIAAVAALGVAVIWLVARWWRRRPRRTPAAIDPLADATREFDALDHVGLLEAGEAGRYVTLAVEIVRMYLVRRVAPTSIALTTAELMGAVSGDARVPHLRLRALLATCDQVKFARHPLSAAQARTLGAEARGIVADVDRRVTVAAATPAPPPSNGPDTGSARRGRAA